MTYIDGGWILLLCLTGFMVFLQAHTFTRREKKRKSLADESMELLSIKAASESEDVKRRLDRLERAEALLNFIVKDYHDAKEKDENNKHARKIVRMTDDSNN
jgi:hypothetical protein